MQKMGIRVLYRVPWYANDEKRGGVPACREVHEALEIQGFGHARDAVQATEDLSITHCTTFQGYYMPILMLTLDPSCHRLHCLHSRFKLLYSLMLCQKL